MEVADFYLKFISKERLMDNLTLMDNASSFVQHDMSGLSVICY